MCILRAYNNIPFFEKLLSGIEKKLQSFEKRIWPIYDYAKFGPFLEKEFDLLLWL